MKTKEKLEQIFSKHIALVEPVIDELIVDSVEERHVEAVRHQIATGGKRIRPFLMMLSCQLFGGTIDDVIRPAAGVEIMHNYTLIVDDIIDHSHFRRGMPTVWKKYGTSIAECFGLYYSAAAFQGFSQSKEARVLLEVFAKALKKVTDGEILDILFEKAGRDEDSYVVKNRFKDVALEDYIEMIGGKTASLFKACCEAGGVCGGASEKQIESLIKFGYDFGIAFQIRDDILDIFGDEEKFGKEIGKDIKESKLSNIVIMLSFEELKGKDKDSLESILSKDDIGKKEVDEAIGLIDKTSARKKAQKLAEDYIDKAKKNLPNLPQSSWNETLSDLADYIVAREV